MFSRLTTIALGFALLILIVGCDEDAVAPPDGITVPIRILAQPDLDTLSAWQSLTLIVEADSGPPPTTVIWSVLPGADSTVATSFVYAPGRSGTEVVRARAEFEGGGVGVAERAFFVRANSAPTIEIQGVDGHNLRFWPVVDTIKLVALVEDPDGDPIVADQIHWSLETEDGLELLGVGDTLTHLPGGLGTYRLLAEATDSAGALAVDRYVIETYDPLTPYAWRTHVTGHAVRMVSLVPGVGFVAHDGQRTDNHAIICGCAIAAVDEAGGRLWELSSPAGGPPLSISDAGNIYIGRGTHEEVFVGELLSIGPAGDVQWTVGVDGEGRGAAFAPALLGDGSLILATSAGIATSARAVTKLTSAGVTVWTTPLDSVYGNGGISRLAVAQEGTIYVAANHDFPTRPILIALDSDGAILWYLNRPGEGGGHDVVIADDSTVLFVADSLYAVGSDGGIHWSSGTAGSPALGPGGVIYYVAGSSLHAIELADGSEIWEISLPNSFHVSPVITVDGQVIVGVDKELISFSTATGQELWRHRAAGVVSGDPLLTDEGLLVFGDSQGYLEALDIGVGLAASPWPMAWANARRTAAP